MVTIPNLTEVTSALTGDDFVIETNAGTRRISRVNSQLRRSELTQVVADNLNVDQDRLWFSDNTDGVLKAVNISDVIFGNFPNLEFTDGFALSPALHNIRVLELLGTFTSPNITISNLTAGIGGCQFNLVNFSSTDITVTALDTMTMFENGAITSPTTIRQNTAATLLVRTNGNQVVFSGG